MSDEISKINILIEKFTNVWNKHDAKEFAELFVDDGEGTDVLGQHVKGKEQIKKLHEYPFKSVLKEAILIILSIRNRSITKDIFAIDVEWKTTRNKPQMENQFQIERDYLTLLLPCKEIVQESFLDIT